MPAVLDVNIKRHLCIHWRTAHLNRDRLEAVRSLLAQHPGDDEVIVRLSSGENVRLGVTVDASAVSTRDFHYATECSAMAHVIDPAVMWN